MKSEVYSWRLSPHLKQALEEAARREKTNVSALLDGIVEHWLIQNQRADDEESEQRRLHAKAAQSLGAIRGKDPRRSERVSELVRDKLAKQIAR